MKSFKEKESRPNWQLVHIGRKGRVTGSDKLWLPLLTRLGNTEKAEGDI